MWSVFCSYLSQKPRDQVAKDNGLVGLGVAGRRGDSRRGPEIALPLVEPAVAGAGVEEEHAWGAVNQPSAVEHLDAAVVHRLHGRDQGRVLGLNGLDLDGRLDLLAERFFPLLMEAARTDALFHGPMSVYAAPYSAVVTWAFDLSTE